MKPAEIEFEYTLVHPCIYIGTNQCCIMDFKKELLRKGVRADISLENDRVDTPKGVRYFLWLPTKDNTPPSAHQLELGVSFIRGLVARKIKMYVHCRQGHGRAPTLVAAYLISTGMTTDQSIAYLKKRRRVIHLNTKQVKSLRAFERKWWGK